MLRNIIIIPFFIGLVTLCFGQEKQASIILGVETGGSFSIVPKRNQDVYDRFWAIRTAPYVDIRAIKNLYLGLNYEIETASINQEKIKPLKGYGAHARYFLPFFKNNLEAKSKVQIYSDLTFVFLNHIIDRTQPIGIAYLSDYSNLNIQFTLGASFIMFNSLYVNAGFRPMFYTKGKPYQWSNKLGLEYHFGEKRIKYTKTPKQPDNNKIPKEAILDFSSFLNRTTIGTSFTYIRNRTDEQTIGYREKTWNLNIAVSITSDIDLGLAVLPIWFKNDGEQLERRLLSGIFAQYDFIRQFKGNRLFIETGYYRGNHCTCGEQNPYYRDNLSYIPIGGGYEAKISKNLPIHLDLSVLFYQILNKVPDEKFAFGQYIVGINYHLYP